MRVSESASTTAATRITVVACGVFRPALTALQRVGRLPSFDVVYLPSSLHLDPKELRRRLDQALSEAPTARRLICLYGGCVPDMDDLCKRHGAARPPGGHCYEMLLGSRRYGEIIGEHPGTYFVEQGLALHFDERCWVPLGLGDERVRRACFGQYERVLYVRQRGDPDLSTEVAAIAGRLGLRLETEDGDYSELEGSLSRLLENCSGHPKGEVTLVVEPDGPVLEVPTGGSILTVLASAGVPIRAECGGVGRCGSCRVTVGEGLPVLACQSIVDRDMTVRIEGATDEAAPIRVLASDERPEVPLDPLGDSLGLALDAGTSTLVGKLVDLDAGAVVAVATGPNRGACYGADVVSRLQQERERPHGLALLHGTLVDDVNRLVDRLLGLARREREEVTVAVVAGNPTMAHLLLGESPAGIGTAPFTPGWTGPRKLRAAEVEGLALADDALLHLMPVASGFVGGDLFSTVLATGAAEQQERLVLGLDLGTNGEVFLGSRERLLVCSAAAGPAFEGGRISRGMIAAAGAIERVRLAEGELLCDVVGGGAPRGICGSGLLDLVAVLLRAGVVRDDGRIVAAEAVPPPLRGRIADHQGGRGFVVVPAGEALEGAPIVLTQQDVRELQLAKGAIAAAVELLLVEYGAEPEGVDRTCLAGAFAHAIDPESAMSIGLVPRMSRSTVEAIGNSAVAGATMALLSRRQWQRAGEIAETAEHVELATRPDFNERFVKHLAFPVGE